PRLSDSGCTTPASQRLRPYDTACLSSSVSQLRTNLPPVSRHWLAPPKSWESQPASDAGFAELPPPTAQRWFGMVICFSAFVKSSTLLKPLTPISSSSFHCAISRPPPGPDVAPPGTSGTV